MVSVPLGDVKLMPLSHVAGVYYLRKFQLPMNSPYETLPISFIEMNGSITRRRPHPFVVMEIQTGYRRLFATYPMQDYRMGKEYLG